MAVAGKDTGIAGVKIKHFVNWVSGERVQENRRCGGVLLVGKKAVLLSAEKSEMKRGT